MRYIIYNTGSASKIVRQGDCPEDQIPLQVFSGETALALPDLIDLDTGVVTISDVDISTHYVLSGVPTAYTGGELAIKATEGKGKVFDVSTMAIIDGRTLSAKRQEFYTKFAKLREEKYIDNITTAAGTFNCADYDRDNIFHHTIRLQILTARSTPTTIILVNTVGAAVTMSTTDMEDLCLAIASRRDTILTTYRARIASISVAPDLTALEAITW